MKRDKKPTLRQEIEMYTDTRAHVDNILELIRKQGILVKPDKNSISQFEPFYQILEKDLR